MKISTRKQKIDNDNKNHWQFFVVSQWIVQISKIFGIIGDHQ